MSIAYPTPVRLAINVTLQMNFYGNFRKSMIEDDLARKKAKEAEKAKEKEKRKSPKPHRRGAIEAGASTPRSPKHEPKTAAHTTSSSATGVPGHGKKGWSSKLRPDVVDGVPT